MARLKKTRELTITVVVDKDNKIERTSLTHKVLTGDVAIRTEVLPFSKKKGPLAAYEKLEELIDHPNPEDW